MNSEPGIANRFGEAYKNDCTKSERFCHDPNYEIRTRIVVLVGLGFTFRAACGAAGISTATGRRWKRRDVYFKTATILPRMRRHIDALSKGTGMI